MGKEEGRGMHTNTPVLVQLHLMHADSFQGLHLKTKKAALCH